MQKEKNNAMPPRELARALGVSIVTIARWKKAGCPYTETAPCFIGAQASRPRYNLAAVKEWIKQQKAGHEKRKHLA